MCGALGCLAHPRTVKAARRARDGRGTAAWAAIRERELRRAGSRCEGCGGAGALTVHKVTGGAHRADAAYQVLCLRCHGLRH